MPKTVTTEEWVSRAMAAHGNKYSYPTEKWGDYTGRSKLPIVCPIHGEFLSTLSNHTHITRPTGCPICADKYVKSREERIAQATSVHGDKYDYSLWPEKLLAGTMVETLCKACNKTWRHNVDNHVRGRGCPNCQSRLSVLFNEKKQEQKISSKKLSRDLKIWKGNQYLELAKERHSGKYDYSLIPEVFNVKSLQPVVCPDHGKFFTIPYNHAIRGAKCPQCVNEQMSARHMFGFDKWLVLLSEKHPDYTFRQHEDGSHTAKSSIYVT